jgi:hypothetical protein
MILDRTDIANLRKSGTKVKDASGKPVSYEPKKETETDYLKAILETLGKILAKPDPDPITIPPPEITVQPKITVATPPVKPVKEWEFAIHRDVSGKMDRVTATAID